MDGVGYVTIVLDSRWPLDMVPTPEALATFLHKVAPLAQKYGGGEQDGGNGGVSGGGAQQGQGAAGPSRRNDGGGQGAGLLHSDEWRNLKISDIEGHPKDDAGGWGRVVGRASGLNWVWFGLGVRCMRKAPATYTNYRHAHNHALGFPPPGFAAGDVAVAWREKYLGKAIFIPAGVQVCCQFLGHDAEGC